MAEEHRAKARAAINRSMNDPAGTYSERLEVNVAAAIADAATTGDAEARAREAAKAISQIATSAIGIGAEDEWLEKAAAVIAAALSIPDESLITCACGDMFNKDFPGTCPNCIVAASRPVDAKQIVDAVMRCLQQTAEGDVYVDELRAKVRVERILRGELPPSDPKANASYDLETASRVVDEAELNEIEARLKDASTGQWVASGNGVHHGTSAIAITHGDSRYANAEFIAHAPTDIRRLLKMLGRKGK